MSKQQKKFAVFDIDGTLIRWQLYHAMCDHLAKKGYISQEAFQDVRDARMKWKKREDISSFHDYELLVIAAFDSVIQQVTPTQISQIIHEVFNEYKDQSYSYTRELIRELKANGYLLFAISASPKEIVQLLAEHYGFDDFGGSVYEVLDGSHTGNKFVLKSDEKPKYLQSLIEKHNCTLKGSIGVGDSDGDIAMLSLVEHPTVINPNAVLFEHAKAHNWKIVVERKNVIYTLEPSNGQYQLLA